MPFHPSRLTHLLFLAGLALSLAVAQPAPSARTAAAVPPGFVDILVTNVVLPTALAFTPDGRLLITTQPGQLRVYQNGALLAQPALDLTPVTCSGATERGLLGVAVDPDFGNNHFIYLYYTFKNSGTCATASSGTGTLPVNRVSRFTLSDNNLASSEVVLIDNILSTNGNHNGGDLHFGADGALYVSTGEAGTGSNAQTTQNLSGKILRINTNGSVPVDNPFHTGRRCGDPAGIPQGTDSCREIFAYGLRNPFRFAFRPGTSDFYINDVGAGTWEEIDVGMSGANYGWPQWEGPCPSDNLACMPGTPSGTYTDPIGYYNHSDTGCETITGGAFVPSGMWPAQYNGAYLFADFGCGKLFRVTSSGLGNFSTVDFATGLGANSVTSLLFGPSSAHALYYTTYASGGQVRLIRLDLPIKTYFPIVGR